MVVYDESVLSSTNSSSSSEECACSYSKMSDDEDHGEKFDTHEAEDPHGTCKNTAATSPQPQENFDTCNEVICVMYQGVCVTLI